MNKAAAPVGIYIHIPFCTRKCPYCDFYSLAFDGPLADRYVSALVRAIRGHPFGDLVADTVYIGGGTPTTLGPKRLEKLLLACTHSFNLGPDSEITLEANPASAMDEDLAALKNAGFNRISFGVQSLNAAELMQLGRLHGPDEAIHAIESAHQTGFDNISADLMLAIPGQTRASLRSSIHRLAALPVNHISAYLLKIEESTPFAALEDTLALPDEDTAAQLYLDCVEMLAAKGFEQYEISNFACRGAVSRHNLKYWRCRDYLGLGPAAHSFMRGKRFYFPRNLDSFLTANNPFSTAISDGDGGSAQERLLLRLRLREGMDLTTLDLPKQNAAKALALATDYAKHGFMTVNGQTIALTPKGFLLSNTITAELLDRAGL